MIHRTAVLESVTATDGQSVVETHNKYFDKLTGQPVVTEVKNNFGAPVYSMTYPGYWEYENMGQASQNQHLKFYAKTTVQGNDDRFSLYDYKDQFGAATTPSNLTKHLFEGDEFIVYSESPNAEEPPVMHGKATLVRKMKRHQFNCIPI